MSWVTVALGLIREAATTELGREIISDLKSNASRKRGTAPPSNADQIAEWRRSVDERIAVTDRNIEMLVKMSNAQDEALVKIQKRQRVWNLVLSGVMLLLGIVVGWLWIN